MTHFALNKVSLFLIAALVGASYSFSQTIDTTEFTSLNTGDKYELIIKRPKDFDASKKYTLVYFADATLNSGKYILALDAERTKYCVLIGIGHIGNHVMRRQRDFIPSDAGGFSSKEFGQASKFYLFMKNELMPFVEGKIAFHKNKIFIGHSFGGLMSLYFSLKENKLFDEYYAVSPSVWANYNELLKMEELYKYHSSSYNSTIHLYAGSLEVLNKVLSSTTEFYDKVKSRNYTGLSITFKKIEWANHYTIVDDVVTEIFESLK
jgi:predicted alpha/beta superfamily hydrolase